MSSQLVLSLFPGIGLLDIAFEEAGFCVVRGPDVLWGGDIHRFHPPAGRFDGVIGGPPCQRFSRLRHIVIANGYEFAPNLIPEYERVVAEAAPAWFVMENVADAPEPVVPGYAVTSVMLNNRWFDGVQNRMRRWCFGIRGAEAVNPWRYIDIFPLEPAEWAHAVCARGREAVPVRLNKNGKRKGTLAGYGTANKRTVADALRLQGLPADLLDKAPLTVEGKQLVIGNGVPLPMGRAIAAAVLAMCAEGVTS